MDPRKDDYLEKAKKYQNFTDKELEEKFWKLVDEVVDPLVELSKTHTTPSIERSVLLRMGFNSLEAKKIVDIIYEKNLLSKGAGNVILKLSKRQNISIKEAGHSIINGKNLDLIVSLFEEGEKDGI